MRPEEADVADGAAPASPRLNSNQVRRVVSTFAYVADLLRDIERLAHAGPTPFARERADVSETDARLVLALLDTARRRMLGILDALDIPRPAPRISARWSMLTALRFIDVALSELTPGTLRGYGDVDDRLAEQVEVAAAGLRELVVRGHALLEPREAERLREQLADVPEPLGEILRRAESFSDDHGLVEVRPLIAAAAERATSTTLEIGIFGRVSSGKSSLINAIVGAPLLPVGATPVTAVPLRVVHGDPNVRVCFRAGNDATIDLTALPDFATEQGNPDNARDVVSIVINSPALPPALALLDTPGVGSMSQSGPAQAFAALPRCDVGVVLVAAGTPVGGEELALVRGLAEAGIRVHVLLSKSDLLADGERDAALDYVRGEFAAAGHAGVSVHAVSTTTAGRAILDGWLATVLQPLVAAHERVAASARARRAHAILAALARGVRDRGATNRLDETIHRTRLGIQREIDAQVTALERAGVAAIDRAATAVASAWRHGGDARAAAKEALRAPALEALAAMRRAADRVLASSTAEGADVSVRIPPVFDPPLLEQLPLARRSVMASVAPTWAARKALVSLRPALDEAYFKYALRLRAWALAREEANAEHMVAVTASTDEAIPAELAPLAQLVSRAFPSMNMERG